VYMDSDTLITNYSVPFSWFIGDDPNLNLIFTDHNVALNNGVFLIRNTKWSFDFLDDCLKLGQEIHGRGQRWAWDDQGAMFAVLVRLAHRSYRGAGQRPTYEDRCAKSDKCCDFNALQGCFVDHLDQFGHRYGDRAIEHILFVDPRYFEVSAHLLLEEANKKNKSSHAVVRGWIRGGFDQYRRAELPDWVLHNWADECFWQRGDMVMHSYHKVNMVYYVPQSLPVSCDAVLQQDVPSMPVN